MDYSKIYTFEDVSFPLITYNPSHEKKISKKNFSAMTIDIDVQEAEANTDHPENDQFTQTEDLGVEQADDQNEYDEEDLSKFLKRSLPRVLQAVIENETSQAFTYYDVLVSLNSSDNQCLYTLHNKENAIYERENQLEITDISWNSTGLILATSLGKFEHDGMCYDKGFIYIWNLQKRGFKPDEPTITIETSACMMCLEFHPTKPSILAGGSFNGEVFLWDISREDENLLFFSRIDDYFHREAVSQIIWLEQKLVGRTEVLYNMMSISTDGKALIWNIDHKLKFPTKGYSLVRKKDGTLSYVGALSIAQSCEEKTCFILGTEAGSVFQLKINPMLNMDRRQKMLFEQKNEYNVRWKEEAFPFMFNLITKNMPEIKMHVESYCGTRKFNEVRSEHIFQSKPDMRKMYPNPIFANYESSTGSVYSVSCSPFHRAAFLIASLDGTVKLFETSQTKAVMTFEQPGYVFKVDWSPARPLVFASASGSGEICIYDLNQNKKGPIHVLRNEDAKGNEAAVALKFNKNQKDLLACGYAGGKIKVYQLSQFLCEPGNEEINTLGALLGEVKQKE